MLVLKTNILNVSWVQIPFYPMINFQKKLTVLIKNPTNITFFELPKDLQTTYFMIINNLRIYYNHNNGNLVIENPDFSWLTWSIKKEYLMYKANVLALFQNKQRLFSSIIAYNLLMQTAIKNYKFSILLNALGFKSHQYTYKNFNILKLKIGYTHQMWVPYSKQVNYLYKADNTFILRSTNLFILSNLTMFIKKLRTPDAYKGKGIWLHYERQTFKTKRKTA